MPSPPHDKTGQQNPTKQQIPELCTLLFGEAAGAAWQTAGERLRRWAAAFTAWRRQREQTRSKVVIHRDGLAWREFLALVNKPPWAVDWRDVQAYIDHSLAAGIKPVTLTSRLTGLSKFYDYCRALAGDDPAWAGEVALSNPVRQVRRPAYPRGENMPSLNVEQALALLAAIDREWSLIGARDYAFFLLHLLTGLRSGEIRQLQRADLRLVDDAAQVRRCTGSHRRWAPLPAPAWAAVKAYLDATGRWAAMAAQDYLFAPLKYTAQTPRPGQPGDWAGDRPLTTSQCHKLLKKYARWAGLEAGRVTMHTLRNTAAVLQYEAENDANALQAFLGHRSVRSSREFLRRLADSPPPPLGDPPQPTRDLSVPPQRGKNWVKPGQQLGLLHGFSAKSLPADQVQAVLAEDISGLDEEIAALQTLSRALLQIQDQVESDDQQVQLSAAYLLAADRLRVLVAFAETLDQTTEDDEWAEAVLAMLDNIARQEGEEPVSEDIRRDAAESAQLGAAGALNLSEQVASARLVLRRTFQLALKAKTVKDLARYTDVYGRGCLRLMRLLKAQGAAGGNLVEYLQQSFQQAIAEINEEWGIDLPR